MVIKQLDITNTYKSPKIYNILDQLTTTHTNNILSSDIIKYIEYCQYKMNAIDRAVYIAYSAIKSINITITKMNYEINKWIAINKATKITELAINSAKISYLEASNICNNIIIDLYKNQIRYLYKSINLLNRPSTPESVISDSTNITENSYNKYKR
jgi:hypothetical protein